MDQKNRFKIGPKSISKTGSLFVILLISGFAGIAISASMVSPIGFLIACVVSGYALLSLLKLPEPLIEDRFD